MSAPTLSAPADLVRRLDPDLFHTALFAPEPGRERLMVLYAFDIELSRAAARASEPMIAAMRLQWWRDVVAEARQGRGPRQHEVAAPLHGLLEAVALDDADLQAVIDGYALELERPFDAGLYSRWADGRFGARTRLAIEILTGRDEAAMRAGSAASQAMAAAFALRLSMRLAAESNTYLLPGIAPEDRAALARGTITETAAAVARALASEALATLRAARAERHLIPKAALPALLPVCGAERVLRRTRLLSPQERAPAGRGPLLLWRALRGRW